jgi:hypothetical protein
VSLLWLRVIVARFYPVRSISAIIACLNRWPGGETVLLPSVSDALDRLESLAAETRGGVQVLVTGSVLLVGDVLGELVKRGHWAPTYPGAAVDRD